MAGKDKPAEKATPLKTVAGGMTLQKCKELGLDPAVYGLKQK